MEFPLGKRCLTAICSARFISHSTDRVCSMLGLPETSLVFKRYFELVSDLQRLVPVLGNAKNRYACNRIPKRRITRSDQNPQKPAARLWLRPPSRSWRSKSRRPAMIAGNSNPITAKCAQPHRGHYRRVPQGYFGQ
jgi:hypothetical protein